MSEIRSLCWAILTTTPGSENMSYLLGILNFPNGFILDAHRHPLTTTLKPNSGIYRVQSKVTTGVSRGCSPERAVIWTHSGQVISQEIPTLV